MPPSDPALVAAIAQGLAVLGMPSVERHCSIIAARLRPEDCVELGIAGAPPYVATVRFRRLALPTAVDSWRSDKHFYAESQFSLQPSPEFTQRDLLTWAHGVVPREALALAREECRRKGVRWPREYPVVERQPA